MGRFVFVTVTVAVQVAVRPLLSVTVKVTVLEPTLAAVKALGVTERVAMPQLSVEPPSTCAADKVAVPFWSRFTVAFWHVAVGLALSLTATVAVQVAVRPLLSVTVKVTTLLPTLEQLKDEVDSERLAMPQLSEELLSTCDAATVAAPPLFKLTDKFWQIAVGLVLSTTVTVAAQVEVLPWPSLTVSTTLLLPVLAQVKDVAERLKLAVPQLSEEPLFTCAAVTVAVLPTKFTVIF